MEFSLSIPGTGASVEKVFTVTKALLTDERNSFLIETIKEMIVTKTHIQNFSCNDIYNLILKKSKLLQEIRLSRKYGTSTVKEEASTSTSDVN
jgi:hypothetical protein